MKMRLLLLPVLLCYYSAIAQPNFVRTRSFNDGWKFFLGDAPADEPSFEDNSWRKLNLPHDWSIEMPFDSASPTGTGGGALRGGTGWYRKTFTIPAIDKGKAIAITFDGVYRNSEMWINGHYLGKRPNGYISFQYDITHYLKYG